MEINIDQRSGFCFGVINAIKVAEEQLQQHGNLYCLGDIVHNNKEVERLKEMGLEVISHQEFEQLKNARVLIRAHGEPPSTYELARQNNIGIIDASCPVVLKLQNKVRTGYEEVNREQGQVVIFGKEGHAEVNGLIGQTGNDAIVVGNNFENLDTIDFSKPIVLYSQTTQNKEDYENLIALIKQKIKEQNCNPQNNFKAHKTICGQVSNRGPHLASFSQNHDVVIFVSGKKSSNGKYLYGICRDNNPRTHFISEAEELKTQWFEDCSKVGVCGATSTPMWLMEEVAEKIKQFRL